MKIGCYVRKPVEPEHSYSFSLYLQTRWMKVGLAAVQVVYCIFTKQVSFNHSSETSFDYILIFALAHGCCIYNNLKLTGYS